MTGGRGQEEGSDTDGAFGGGGSVSGSSLKTSPVDICQSGVVVKIPMREKDSEVEKGCFSSPHGSSGCSES